MNGNVDQPSVSEDTGAQRQGTKHRPLVSVVIIFLNAEKFLAEAIESVLAQTYTRWELLLADDGSTDGSTELARRYAREAPGQIRYVDHPGHVNCGMSATRNLALKEAHGEYIAFLDADDIWAPQKVARQVAILEAQPDAAMVFGPSHWWHSWTGSPSDARRDFITTFDAPSDSLVEPPTLLIQLLQKDANISPPSGILVRREVVERVGGFEASFTGMSQLYEDKAFYAKVCLDSAVFVSSECWFRYRRHPDACGTAVTVAGKYYAARLSFLTWLAAYLTRRGVDDANVWAVLRSELWHCRYPTARRARARVFSRMVQVKGLAVRGVVRALPPHLRSWLRERLQGDAYCPPVGWVRLGSLRRVTPIRQVWESDSGRSVDRYYIEKFLSVHAADIRGRVLTVSNSGCAQPSDSFQKKRGDILTTAEGTPVVAEVSDLASASDIPSDSFDCVLVNGTLQHVYDVPAALRTLYRVLRPGGVVLATLPGITRISGHNKESPGQYWSFTSRSVQRLFEETFPPAQVQVGAAGNVLTATALLHGLAIDVLRPDELDHLDPEYEVVIMARAAKPEAAS